MRLPERPRAVVTGAASGLGRSIAVALAERGGRLVVVDVHAARIEESCALVRQAGGEAVGLVCDVTRVEELERAADASEAAWGGTDLLVNNAGVAAAGGIGELPIEDWKWIVGVNLWGVIHGCHVFAPRMKAAGRGWILNVASSAGFAAMPEMAPYNVTKAGVMALSETLYAELARDGVSVSVLCPTFFRTNLTETMRTTSSGQRRLVEKLFARAKITADQVAQAAIAGLENEELVVIPQLDGTMMYRLKRWAPGVYHKLLRAQHTRRMMEKLAARV